jgi:Fe-S cluster biogenesis protein NfuA
MTEATDPRIEELRGLIEKLRPAVQADGGDLELVAADPETGRVEVRLAGACASCAISTTTIKGGVERILKARLPWVREVEGDLDTATATTGRGAWQPIAIRRP